MPSKVSKQNPKSEGFTLVELMIAVTILAILSVLALTVLTGVMKQARDAKRISDIDAIYNAMEIRYDSDKSVYPNKIDPLWFANSQIPADPLLNKQNRCGATGTNFCMYCIEHGTESRDECTPPADKDINTDPTLSIPESYLICANLENKVDNLSFYCRHSARK